MKYSRFLAIATIVAASASCTLSVKEYVAPDELVQEQELTITATCDEPETRTVRAEDKSVLWSPGDQISLFYGSGADGGSCFTAQNTELARTANFTGTIGVITAGNDVSLEGTYFWATYPYNPMASCDGSSLTTFLPSSQVAVADTFADNLFPTIGRSRGLRMGFYNICGGLCFTVSEEGIASVTLEGHNDEVIAGKMTVGFDSEGLPIISDVAEGSKTITVTAPVGTTFDTGKTYYIVLVPTVFENGFTLTFRKANYMQAVYDRTKATTIRRSAFGTLATPDAGLEWSMAPSITFPDPNFNAYMMQNFDTNGNGVLEREEALAVTNITVSTDNIGSVEGIAYCPNLQTLSCNGSGRGYVGNELVDKGQLKKLDISFNSNLINLYCGYNQLMSLDVSANIALQTLNCNYNLITSLDVSANSALQTLNCGHNNLTSLDVSANTNLITLYCTSNQLTSLDVNSNTALVSLGCTSNRLSLLDVSRNTILTSLKCGDNNLTSLDVSNNTALDTLICFRNRLTALDVIGNTALKELNVRDNLLTSFDVSANTELTRLLCFGNHLSSLDVSANIGLTFLNCSSNQLTSLNVSQNTALTNLYCYGNLLATLNISKNTALTTLDCSPMNDNEGNNLLSFLYIADGQSIPNVTGEGRNANYVPADTIITLAPGAGGNEGTGDDEL